MLNVKCYIMLNVVFYTYVIRTSYDVILCYIIFDMCYVVCYSLYTSHVSLICTDILYMYVLGVIY
jgi:hypothetical protein